MAGLVFAVLVGFLIRWIVHGWFLFPLEVPDSSMEPAPDVSLKSGEVVYVSRMFSGEDLTEGSLVLFFHPLLEDTRLIRRIVAGPGKTVEIIDGEIYVQDRRITSDYQQAALRHLRSKREILPNSWDQMAPLTLQKEEYFVIADDRNAGLDSRFFGPVKRSRIQGLINP